MNYNVFGLQIAVLVGGHTNNILYDWTTAVRYSLSDIFKIIARVDSHTCSHAQKLWWLIKLIYK